MTTHLKFALLACLHVLISTQEQDSVKVITLTEGEQWEAMQIIQMVFEFE